MARPKKNVSALQGSYAKEELKKRVEQENKIKGDFDKLEVPPFIMNDDVASSKFLEIVEELKKADILSNVDVDLLGAYCDCYSKYVQTTLILATQDLVEIQESKLGDSRVPNPYIKIQQVYMDKLIKISNLFGLSPSDRSKIAHIVQEDKEKEVNPLLELLSGIKKNV